MAGSPQRLYLDIGNILSPWKVFSLGKIKSGQFSVLDLKSPDRRNVKASVPGSWKIPPSWTYWRWDLRPRRDGAPGAGGGALSWMDATPHQQLILSGHVLWAGCRSGNFYTLLNLRKNPMRWRRFSSLFAKTSIHPSELISQPCRTPQ